MKKQFILNLLLNLGIIFLVISGFQAYEAGNMLFVGLALAISIVLIYLKIVLLKHVKQEVVKQQQDKIKKSAQTIKKNKKG